MNDVFSQTIALDIDDTLADSVVHFTRQLNDRYGNPENKTPEELVENYHSIPHMTFWQTPEIKAWLEEQAFSNDAQYAVPAMHGAQTVVQEIAERYNIIYVSSRPTAVYDGTHAWLQKEGFPEGELILRNKQFQAMNGNAWKAQILTQPERNVVAIIDDNPEIISHVSRLYKGVVYLFGKATLTEYPGVTVRKCRDWHDVSRALHEDQLLT